MNEIAKFDALAADWWNPNGSMKPLHQLNPLRLQYIKNHAPLETKKILDLGCGGGILAEAMAKEGGQITGIDLSESLIHIAQQHAQSQNLAIDYQLISSHDLSAKQKDQFDIITCMELLEHVTNPENIIQDCAALVKPGGYVFFATLNRTVRSFLEAIIGAEYIMKLLPKGTHQYAQFIRPSELTLWAVRAGLTLKGLQGIVYYPLVGKFQFHRDASINYIAYFQRSAEHYDNT